MVKDIWGEKKYPNKAYLTGKESSGKIPEADVAQRKPLVIGFLWQLA